MAIFLPYEPNSHGNRNCSHKALATVSISRVTIGSADSWLFFETVYFSFFTSKIISMENYNFYKPVILCVGTVKVIGDSVGPKVGDRLIKKGVDAYVYGKSSRPVNGINYESYVEFIKTHHPHSLVIAVDACLGTKTDVGKIKYTLNSLRAGAALKKNLTSFGDLTVLCVVAEKTADNLHSLLYADKKLINSLAEKTADKIFTLVEDLRLNYTQRHKIEKEVSCNA